MIETRLFSLTLAGCLALLAGIPIARAAEAVPTSSSSLDGTWSIRLEGFFEPPAKKKNATVRRTLPIYINCRDGKLLYGMGSAPDWNQTTHPADVSGLNYDAASGKLTGTMRVRLNADQWFPSDHQAIECSVEVNATLDRANPADKSAMQGTYRAKFGNTPVDGRLSGNVLNEPMVDLGNCQVSLILNHVLPSGLAPAQNRLAVRLDITDGQTVAAQYGLVGMNNQPYDFRPLEKFKVASTRDGFSGELVIPRDAFATLGEGAAEFLMKIAGKRINNLCGGEFTMQVVLGGKTTAQQGNFKGSISPPAPSEARYWEKELNAPTPWFAPVKNFKPLTPGEHPRLFFRKNEVPELKRRAATPEGQQIVARLKATLGGGEEMPKHFSKATKAYDASIKEKLPEGAYTISHAAGFGMLYQLTGDKKYADLGRKCFELGLSGQRDRDDRYSFRAPGGQLRAGPTLGMYALAYDLCYDAWPEAFRRMAALALQNWSDAQSGEWAKAEDNTLKSLCLAPHQMPASNHWGSQLGAGLVVISLLGDPGTDDALLQSCLNAVEKNMIRGVTAGYGDGGFYSEGPGPAHMMANPGFVPLVQACKSALGKDYITPRPNFSWMTLHWIMETLTDANGQPIYPCRKPSTYGNEHMLDGNGGISHGGWFSQGFGAIPEASKPALLWLYNHYAAKADQNRRDTANYPHRAIAALVNWPLAVAEKNPADVLGRTSVDRLHGWYVFRNGWQGADDVVVSAWLGSGPKGNIKLSGPDVMVWGMGERLRLASLPACQTTFYQAGKDGSGVVSGGGVSLAVDFSGRCGAPVMVVVASKKDMGKFSGKIDSAIAKVSDVQVDQTNFRVLTMGRGAAPPVKADGAKVRVGERTVSFDGQKVVVE